MWVCRHFNCLPTEERFRELTPEQKAILFYGYLEAPTDQLMHETYASGKESAELLNAEVKENFKKMGYTDEQIKRIEDNAKLAGLT